MHKCELNILGTKYNVYDVEPCDERTLDEYDCDCLGTTDYTTHEIMIRKSMLDRERVKCACPEVLYKQTLRHEIIHAFFAESGLTGVDEWTGSLYDNEVLVDWLAMQFPKILEAFKEADCL